MSGGPVYASDSDLLGVVSVAGLDSPPHIAKDEYTIVSAPNQPAEEESSDQEDTIDSLVDGSGKIELVAEPVNI